MKIDIDKQYLLGGLCTRFFADNSDSVCKSSTLYKRQIIINKSKIEHWEKSKVEKNALLTHGAVVFEGFGDLSAGQVAKVGRCRLS